MHVPISDPSVDISPAEALGCRAQLLIGKIGPYRWEIATSGINTVRTRAAISLSLRPHALIWAKNLRAVCNFPDHAPSNMGCDASGTGTSRQRT